MSDGLDLRFKFSFIVGVAVYFLIIHLFVMPVLSDSKVCDSDVCVESGGSNYSKRYSIFDPMRYPLNVLNTGVVIMIIPLLAMLGGIIVHWAIDLPFAFIRRVHYQEIEKEKRKLRQAMKKK